MKQQVGLDFEFYVQAMFEDREIPVFETPTTNDYGADLVLYRHGKVVVIQCKYHSAPIGIHAVQEVVGAIKHYRADGGIVISNQVFTRQAVVLAQSNHVLLIDGNMLQGIMNSVSDELLFIDEFLKELRRDHSVQQMTQPVPQIICRRRWMKKPMRVKLRQIKHLGP